MNDDNLNYRFRLITFNDNVSVKNLDPEMEIPSSPEEPKPAKYSLSSAHMESEASHAKAKPQPVRLSKSSTEIMAKKPYKNKVLKNPRNTIGVEDFSRMITSRDNMYPDKLVDCDEATTKNKNIKEKVKNRRKNRKTHNHHRWHKDVKVIYTSETTKIPRRRRTDQPPDHFAYQTHEFRDDFDSLYKNNDYYQQNVFKNNPAVYFQSSGDCRKGIFGKIKKSKEIEDENDYETCEHFPVADMGDYCEDESPSSYNCTHLPHFNVVGFPQNNKTKCKLQPPQNYRGSCGQSLTTLNFNDFESETRFKTIRSQPCPLVSHAHECEAGSKSNYENQSSCANMVESKAMPKKICEREPTVKISRPKNTSDSSKATAKKVSSKLSGQSEEKLKKTSVDTKSKQTCPCSVTTKTRSTTPKKTKRSQSEPLPGNTTNGYLKYIFYGIAVIVFFPCALLFSLCWLATYPLRPREAVPNLSKQSTQNNSSVRKPRERNLCHLNRAPKVLTNSIDNWSTIKHAVACACKSALPSSQKTVPPRSCSSKPSSPRQCQKSTSSKVSCKKVSNTFDACPIKIPPCAIQSYGQRHPDPSQQYRMFYGGALRGWLMKPLSCYGVTCKSKNISYRNVCPATVMPVKTAGEKTKQKKEKPKKDKKEKGKKEKGKKEKVKKEKGKTEKGKTETDKTEKGKTEKGKTEKKAVKFSNEIATPMPNTVQRQHPLRQGENRPCTDPRPSKKPCRVCCQPIRPDLDPSNVGLVKYGPKQKGKNPFKKKKKKVPVKKKKKEKKKKPKKKKKSKKSKEENKGLVQAIKDAEDEAWGNEEVKCDEIWVRTLRKKPCFWVYKRWPSLYPCFLQWHSCCANCASCGIMCLSVILWCPLLICVFICYKMTCKK